MTLRNQVSMFNIHSKHHVQVQFMTFGVEHQGILIPILKREKIAFVHLPPATGPALAKGKDAPTPR